MFVPLEVETSNGMNLFDDVCLGRKDPGSQLRATTVDLTRHTYLPPRRRNAEDFSTTRLKGGLTRTTNGVVALCAFDALHQTTTPCGVRAENMQL